MKIEKLEKPEISESNKRQGDNSKEKYLSEKERVKMNYKRVIDLREAQYDEDVRVDPNKESMRRALDVHNNIVFDYALDLIEKQNLSGGKRVAAIIATVMHDGGKLSSSLLEHHARGIEYAEQILDKMQGEKFEGIELTEEIKKKVKDAIERHMNHPFLVMLNKNKKFPLPQDEVDRVVFDADMLANIGFKNVAFRLDSQNFLNEDKNKSSEKGIAVIQESFENVVKGCKQLEGTVLSIEARKMAEDLIDKSEKIFEYMKEKGRLEYIQNIFSHDKGFDVDTIKMHGGVEVIKKLLNEEIEKAGAELNIDKKIIKKFIM
jgi:hypothetical protein